MRLRALIGMALAVLPALASAQTVRDKVDRWVLDTAARGDTEFLVMLRDLADLRGARSLKTRGREGRLRGGRPLLHGRARAGAGPGAARTARRAAPRVLGRERDLGAGRARARRGARRTRRRRPPLREPASPPEPAGGSPVRETGGDRDDRMERREGPRARPVGARIRRHGHRRLRRRHRVSMGPSGVEDPLPRMGRHPPPTTTTAGTTRSTTPRATPAETTRRFPATTSATARTRWEPWPAATAARTRSAWLRERSGSAAATWTSATGTPARYTECFQWFIAPTDLSGQNPDPTKAPAVINDSWTCPASEGCTDPTVLQAVVESVRAAGIEVVASAGNDGPSCSTVDQAPAIYAAAFTVGATDMSDVIAGFSSRGPVTVDGSNRPKPEISAPGVDVRSSYPVNGYEDLDGTSMAGPHVVGVSALAMSAIPDLVGDPDGVEALLTATAVPRTTIQTCGGVPGNRDPEQHLRLGPRRRARGDHDGHRRLPDRLPRSDARRPPRDLHDHGRESRARHRSPTSSWPRG